MTTKASLKTANAATTLATARALKALEKIQNQLLELRATALHGEGHWGHQGTAGHVANQLEEIANFLGGN